MYKIKVINDDVNVYVHGKKVLRYAILNDFIKLVWSKKAFASNCYHEVWQIEDEIVDKFGKQIGR